jgi:hypothetical protein
MAACAPPRKETTDTTLTDTLDTTKQVVTQRLDAFIAVAPACLLERFKQENIRSRLEQLTQETLPSIEDPLKKMFLCDFLIASTRIFEVYGKLTDGTPRFPDFMKENIINSVFGELKRIFGAFTEELTVQELLPAPGDSGTAENPPKPVMDARTSILHNISVVSRILDIEEDAVDKNELLIFFQNSVKIFICHSKIDGFAQSIGAFSSPDGKKLYIRKDLLDYEPHNAAMTLEHELINCLSRRNERDARVLMPEKNKHLRSTRNVMLEAGDYYEQEVYQDCVKPRNIFCITGPRWRGYW